MKPIYVWTPLKKASEKGIYWIYDKGNFHACMKLLNIFMYLQKSKTIIFRVKLMVVSVVELNNLKMIVPSNCTFLLNYCYFELYICPSIAVIMEYEK